MRECTSYTSTLSRAKWRSTPDGIDLTASSMSGVALRPTNSSARLLRAITVPVASSTCTRQVAGMPVPASERAKNSGENACPITWRLPECVTTGTSNMTKLFFSSEPQRMPDTLALPVSSKWVICSGSGRTGSASLPITWRVLTSCCAAAS